MLIIDSSLNVKNAGRIIDLFNKLVIVNTGKSPVLNFIFALNARQNDHLRLSYISALLREHGRPKLNVKKLEDPELTNFRPHKLFYQIELRDPLPSERSVSVEVEVILTHELTPHPKEIHWSIIKRFAIILICIFNYITVHYYFEIL